MLVKVLGCLLAILVLSTCLLDVYTLLLAEYDYKAGRRAQGTEKLVLLERAVNAVPDSYPYLSALARAEDKALRPVSAYRQAVNAVATRPSWPYAWNFLLDWHVRHADFSATFDLSLERTNNLGNEIDGLVWNIIEHGFATSNANLGRTSKEIFSAAFERGLYSNRNKVLGYAIFKKNIAAICHRGLVTKSDDLTTWCKNTAVFMRLCMQDSSRATSRSIQARCKSGRQFWWQSVHRQFRLRAEQAAN